MGTRSGDKGGDANLGVFVRDRCLWRWLVDWLTIDRLAELLPETAALSVERHELENLMALNFVIVGILGDGVASSTHGDTQAKALGEWLRARVVPIRSRRVENSPAEQLSELARLRQVLVELAQRAAKEQVHHRPGRAHRPC